jgi:sugar phosphate isomerase/epimerase
MPLIPQRRKETVVTNVIELIAGYWTTAGDVYPSGPTEVSPFPFRERVEAAARAGYKGMGLLNEDVQATAEKIGHPEMKRILDANGIKHVQLEFIVDWFREGERRRKSDQYRRQILSAASALGAREVKIGPGLGEDVEHPRPDELMADVPRMAEAFAGLCRDAAEHGTAIVLEFLPFGNVSKLETARAIVEAAGEPNGSLLVDIWHMARGGNDYNDIAKLPARFIGAVELNDADEQVVGTLFNDSTHHRRLPGEGALNPPAFIKAVQAAGYRGPWGVELISRAHRKLPLDEMARRSFETTMAQFKSV